MYSSIRQKLNQGLHNRFLENNVALYKIIDNVQVELCNERVNGKEFVTALKIALLHKNSSLQTGGEIDRKGSQKLLDKVQDDPRSLVTLLQNFIWTEACQMMGRPSTSLDEYYERSM